MTSPTLDNLLSDFDLLDDWEDRYKYVIELGNKLPEFKETLRTDANKVQGCVSQVWLSKEIEQNTNNETILTYTGDSDAHIVRGLIAILLVMYSGQTAKQILQIDAIETLSKFGLQEHLTPQRSNGLFSMVDRIRKDAEAHI